MVRLSSQTLKLPPPPPVLSTHEVPPVTKHERACFEHTVRIEGFTHLQQLGSVLDQGRILQVGIR